MDSNAPHRDREAIERAIGALRWIRRPGGSEEDLLAGGVLNVCYNALDRHLVAGRADETALLVQGSGVEGSWSYARLLEQTAAFAGALRMLGVAPGSSVPMLLPPGRDAVVALLACLRLGAVPHALPRDLGADSLAMVLDDLAPQVLLTVAASAWVDALERGGHEIASVVVRQPADGSDDTAATLTEPRDLEWDFVARAGRNDPAPCARVASEALAYAVVDPADRSRLPVATAGGLAVAAVDRGRALDLDGGREDARAADIDQPAFAVTVLAPLFVGGTLRIDDA